MKKKYWKQLLREEQEAHKQTMGERNDLLLAAEYTLERLDLAGGDMFIKRKLEKSLPPDSKLK